MVQVDNSKSDIDIKEVEFQLVQIITLHGYNSFKMDLLENKDKSCVKAHAGE